jgi:hypothetical protein
MKTPSPKPAHRLPGGAERLHPFARWLVPLALAAACSRGGGDGGPTPDLDTVHPELIAVEFGRLVDVYGLRTTATGSVLALYERDVVVGLDLDDQRPATSTLGDAEVLYDFLANDSDTLQPRLLIPRELGSDEFARAFADLDDDLREVAPMRFGQGGAGLPYSVVPRNAALRLRFSAPLGVDESFFVARGSDGRVAGIVNNEAVQLLQMGGDPEQDGNLAPLPVRVIPRERSLVLDPVLLGSEGLQYQTTNNAAGLPASTNSLGANVRVALALEGPLAIPGLRAGGTGPTGRNNSARPSIVRDFRSGNADDTSAAMTRGFVRDPLPLRLVGEIPMFLERVDEASAGALEVTVWKGGRSHEIDRGDTLRFLRGDGTLLGTADVIVDPIDDREVPTAQHVRVRIRRLEGLAELDPRQVAGYPAELAAREAWLRLYAPRVVCLAEFTAGGVDGRDDPRNFVTFTPGPVPLAGVQPEPNAMLSPFVNAVVRFNKPVDLDTVKWADTLFFAMRNLADPVAIAEFVANVPNQAGGQGMDPGAFDLAKYRTPFLIAARALDEDGSQTSVRLQPTAGFYLDEAMRGAAPGTEFPYFVHLIANSPTDGGVRDLAGNPLDLQGTTSARSASVVVPFTLDTRRNGDQAMQPDNLVVSIVRRYASRDEDPQPSYLKPSEVQPPGALPVAAALPLDDVFGGVVYLDGQLLARPSSRTRVAADNRNAPTIVQQSPLGQPPQPLAICPQAVTTSFNQQGQSVSSAVGNLVGIPIQNPMNPNGARLQTLWREIDLGLSRTDPFDLNLDVEQMYWAPFLGRPTLFDEFDRKSLWLGHSEYRPVPCVGSFSALPSFPDSGLRGTFGRNFVWNPAPSGGNTVESQPQRHPCYVDAPMSIDPSQFVKEPSGVLDYLPLPRFQKPYFVFRDETVMEQGCDSGIGTDLTPTFGTGPAAAYAPHTISPFLNGMGRRRIAAGGGIEFVNSYWNDAPNFRLDSPSAPEALTGGLVGSVALPLLADFWTWCDSASLPADAPYVAQGLNGWQTSVTVQSNLRPCFRVFSGGRPNGATQGGLCIGIGDSAWQVAAGGWAPGASPTAPWVPTPNDPLKGDNTFYWVMMDIVRRQTVATAGFVDLLDPHRVGAGIGDPRLGPWFLAGGQPALPSDVLPEFGIAFDPPLTRLPTGTSVTPQFRGADLVDPQPWYWTRWISQPNALFPAPTQQSPLFDPTARADLRPTADNFPLDPLKAGDAHIRKWDTRAGRNWWSYLYNRTVTPYVEDPNQLMDAAWLASLGAPGLQPSSLRYVNWRFLMTNNVDAQPPTAPAIETFALTYRFAQRP